METTTTQKEVEPVEVTNKVSPTTLLEPELDGDKTRDITPNHAKKWKQTTLCDHDRSLVSSDRRTSGVWKYYTEYLDKWGKIKAKCNYCTSNFASESNFEILRNFICSFQEIFNLQKIICKYVRSEDSILSGMAKKMELKFNNYWGTFKSMNKLLFIVVLNPRYKLKYVEYLFKNSYGCLVGVEKSKKVMDTLSHLYDYYINSFCGTHIDTIDGQTSLNDEIDIMHSDEMWQSQWEKYLADEDNTENKSELEKYLVDDLEKTKELDILAWWKVSSARYPIISRMARDVLSIPISTVASESAFSTGD
ncbi:zinc finger BED domain-containing protein RICESLEEPER 2-like [Solanum dulcamara]|uniref:zinc finger BED domain-containing protein RICESLEEPER 2-like n=1 Tax=Solanum dulcamara TaxID=45834 RepID=UPI0024858B84|nr:zinc finger BED domain-containing protein RICESLEEPER 2-like [Solanum dulcamara]